MDRFSSTVVTIAVLSSMAGTALSQSSTFTEVDLSGLTIDEFYHMAVGMGGGVAIADYDNDGDLDFFLPNMEGLDDRLIQNNGNGIFYDVAGFCGVTGVPVIGAAKPRSRNALWIDYDGDRRLDLFVAGDCWNCLVVNFPLELANASSAAWAKPRLHRQLADGTFENVTADVGLGDVDFLRGDCGASLCAAQICGTYIGAVRHLGGIAAADLNGDDLPDLFVGHWFLTDPRPSTPKNGRFFMSDAAQGIFTDPDDLIPLNQQSHWQTVMADFNEDGVVDAFSARDGATNSLYVNLGPGMPFAEEAANAGLDHLLRLPEGNGGTDMGVAIGDFDNDGFFDFYLTNTNTLSNPEIGWRNDQFLFADPVQRAGTHNVIVHEDRNPQLLLQYVEMEKSWGWGTTAFDANLDGWEDLAITNGFSNIPGFGINVNNQDLCDLNGLPFASVDESLLFINDPSTGGFTNESVAWNFDDPQETGFEAYWGSALGAFDMDRDGDLDLALTIQATFFPDVITPSRFRLLENHFADENTVNWLVVRPRLTTRNTRSLGAVVRASYIDPSLGGGGATITQSRLISAGESFMTQEPAEAHFGFGPIAPTSVTITIEWPDDTPDSVFVQQTSELNRVVTYGWCDVVDLVKPFGVLDSADFTEFQEFHTAGDPIADIAAPVGLGSEDLIEAASRIGAGCPAGSIQSGNELPDMQ